MKRAQTAETMIGHWIDSLIAQPKPCKFIYLVLAFTISLPAETSRAHLCLWNSAPCIADDLCRACPSRAL
jgi:hypothetical protein